MFEGRNARTYTLARSLATLSRNQREKYVIWWKKNHFYVQSNGEHNILFARSFVRLKDNNSKEKW